MKEGVLVLALLLGLNGCYPKKVNTSVASTELIALRNMKVTWTTTGDDKNWDSRPVVDVYDRIGRHVGHVDCCDRDHWDKDMVALHDVNVLVTGLTNADLSHGHFNASRLAMGQDTWDYIATVEFDWVDGTHSTFSCTGTNSCSTRW